MTKHFILFFCLFIALNSYCQNNERYLIRENNLYGYIDNKGNKVIKPQFEKAAIFSEGLAVVKQNGLYGYINIDGKFIIEPQYSFAINFNHGLAKVVKINKQQIITKKGENLLDDKFEGATEINDNYMIVVARKTRKYGVSDLKTKKLVIDTIYPNISDLNNKTCVISKMDQYDFNYISTIINIPNNKLLYPFGKFLIIDKKEDFYILSDSSLKSCVLNNEGKILFKKEFHFSIDRSDEFYKEGIFKIGNTSFVNNQGKILFKDEDGDGPRLSHFCNQKLLYYSLKSGICVLDTNFKVRLKKLNNRRNCPLLNKDSTYTFENGKTQVYDKNFKFVKQYDFKDIYPVNKNFYLFRNNDTINYSLRTYKNKMSFENEINPDEIELINDILKIKIKDQDAYLDSFGNLLWIGNLTTDKYRIYSQSVRHPLELQFYDEVLLEPKPNESLSFNLENRNNEISLNVKNHTEKDVNLIFINESLNVILQAQDENGDWKNVSDQLRTIDGGRFQTLKSNSSFIFKIDSINGSFKTKIRMKYIEHVPKNIFSLSNEIEANINPALFVNSAYF